MRFIHPKMDHDIRLRAVNRCEWISKDSHFSKSKRCDYSKTHLRCLEVKNNTLNKGVILICPKHYDGALQYNYSIKKQLLKNKPYESKRNNIQSEMF